MSIYVIKRLKCSFIKSKISVDQFVVELPLRNCYERKYNTNLIDAIFILDPIDRKLENNQLKKILQRYNDSLFVGIIANETDIYSFYNQLIDQKYIKKESVALNIFKANENIVIQNEGFVDLKYLWDGSAKEKTCYIRPKYIIDTSTKSLFVLFLSFFWLFFEYMRSGCMFARIVDPCRLSLYDENFITIKRLSVQKHDIQNEFNIEGNFKQVTSRDSRLFSFFRRNPRLCTVHRCTDNNLTSIFVDTNSESTKNFIWDNYDYGIKTYIFLIIVCILFLGYTPIYTQNIFSNLSIGFYILRLIPFFIFARNHVIFTTTARDISKRQIQQTEIGVFKYYPVIIICPLLINFFPFLLLYFLFLENQKRNAFKS